jgi:glutamate synthase (NADPH/NADH) small chain
MEGAVTIGAVERTLAERALDAGWRPVEPQRRSDRRVAVIGAGPAGLACAERLNREGVQVTVYDRGTGIGGLLQSAMPAFKLDKDLLARRESLLAQAGIRFRFGVCVEGETLAGLMERNHAVFLGLGAQKPRAVALSGQTLPGVVQALTWLARLNAGDCEDLKDTRVMVLGGGDTAMDSARAALRLGASVTLAYRGPETRLRASTEEVNLTREEGVTILLEHRPLACEGDDRVRGMRFETPHGIRALATDLVILAFGQQPAPPPWLTDFGIATEPDGRVRVDERGRTTHPKVWAGGDNTHGPDLAVTAMAAGRRAAEGILGSFRPLRHMRRGSARRVVAVPSRAVGAATALEAGP